MLIRMTGIGTQIVALIGAATVAAGGLLGAGGGSTGRRARRSWSIPRSPATAASSWTRACATPRTSCVSPDRREARTDVRYLEASGHRVVVAGPQASAAAAGAPAERVRDGR